MDETPVTLFYFLIKETGDLLKDDEIKTDFETFNKEKVYPLLEQEQRAVRPKYVLSFVGLTNVDKSTLITALLDYKKIAPYENRPTTAIPVEYVFAPTWKIKILDYSFNETEESFQKEGELVEAVKKHVLCDEQKNKQNTLWVTVEGPFKILEKGLVLADTPGFSDAQIDDDEQKRKNRMQKLEKFIKDRVDSVYFCVAADDMNIRNEEKNFYNNIRYLCNHIVVNKWEFSEDNSINEQDIYEYKKRYSSLFPGLEFIFVNAKNAIIGIKDEDVTVLKKSNIDYLKSIIEKYSTPEGRIKIVHDALVKSWKNFNRYIEIRHNIKNIPWRRDSLKRFFYICKRNKSLELIARDIERILR